MLMGMCGACATLQDVCMAALEGVGHMGIHAQSADLFLGSWGRQACWMGGHALARASERLCL